METRQISSKVKTDMHYGQVAMLTTTPDQDIQQNKDYILGSFGIAMRRRRFNADKYGEISIRATRLNGIRTEMAKILAGECKANLYIFEFLDCFIICPLSSIRAALEQNIGHEQINNDGLTSAWYIPFKLIEHWRILK